MGVVAHHILTNQVIIAGWVQQLAEGQAVEGVTWDIAHQLNAQHAHEHADTNKAEVLELESKSSADAVRIIEGLSDTQLDSTARHSLFEGNPVSAEQLIEGGLIGHLQHHLKSIWDTIS